MLPGVARVVRPVLAVVLCASVEAAAQFAEGSALGHVYPPGYPLWIFGVTLLPAIAIGLASSVLRAPVAVALGLWTALDLVALQSPALQGIAGVALAALAGIGTYVAIRTMFHGGDASWPAVLVAACLWIAFLVSSQLSTAYELLPVLQTASAVTVVLLLQLPLALTRLKGRAATRAVYIGALFVFGGAILLASAPRSEDGDVSPRSQVAPNADRPSILLLVLDTVRADHLTLDGYARNTTPRLAEFVAEHPRAIVYPRAYSTSNWTIPAHASLFTGLIPSDHGVHYGNGQDLVPSRALRWKLLSFDDTLASRLREVGYRTAGFYANRFLDRAMQLGTGFEVWSRPVAETTFGHIGEGLRHLLWPAHFRPAGSDTVRARLINRDILSELDDCERGCFVFGNYIDAHTTYAPPAPFAGTFTGDSRRAAPPRQRISQSAMQLQQAMDAYDEEILSLDAALGDLLEALESTGRLDEMWLVVTSDHGEGFGEHRSVFHSSALYDEQMRIPLLIHPPAGVDLPRRGGPVSLIDVATTLSLVGSKRTLGKGRDLRAPDWEDGPVQMEFFGWASGQSWAGPWVTTPTRAVVDGKWKLVSYPQRHELFQLDVDPAETRDLARQHPERAKVLRRLLPPLEERPGLLETIRIRDFSETEALRALGYVE